MMRTYRMQGLIFSVLSLVTVLACLLLPRADRVAELLFVAVSVVLLGVPHGALDALFARRLYGTNTLGLWAAFTLCYLLAAGAVFGVWVLAPTLFLIGFLLISVAHFSGDPCAGTLFVSRVLYGGAIIVLPTLLHAAEVSGLFELLAGPHAAAQVMPVFATLAGPWLVTLLGCAVLEARRDISTGAELAAVGLLATIAPPLVAFGLFFCVMHSARHILRTAVYASDLRPGLLLAVALAPMVLVIGASAAGWALLEEVPVATRITRLLFVGLAALTVPHMLLVERVRFSGWKAAT